MKNRITVWVLMGLGVVFSLIPCLMFFCHFRKFQISDQPSDWSNFGEFVGGVSGSLISLLNLFAFIYLTTKIDEYAGKRNNEQIITQKKILVSNLKNEAIKGIYAAFQPLNEELFLQNKINPSTIMNLRMQLIFNVSASVHLFQDIMDNKTYLMLLNGIEDLHKESSEYINTGLNYERFQDKLVEVSGNRAHLIAYLQTLMIADLKN